MTGPLHRADWRRPAPIHPAECHCADCRTHGPSDHPAPTRAWLMLLGFALTLATCLIVGPHFGGIGFVRFFALLGGQ